MNITPKQIESLKTLYKQKYKKELTEEQAITTGTKFIGVFSSILLPKFREVGKK